MSRALTTIVRGGSASFRNGATTVTIVQVLAELDRATRSRILEQVVSEAIVDAGREQASEAEHAAYSAPAAVPRSPAPTAASILAASGLSSTASAVLLETRSVIDRVAAASVVDWLALLDVEVALADGSRFTWGDGTVAQHEARIEMLERQGAAAIENAARHRAAVIELTQAGAPTLRQMVTASARP